MLTIFLWILSWWNVENLFDIHHDSLKNDVEYTVDGARHWTYTRYQSKVENIARVICNMGGWECPMLVGLGEVENDVCLRSLCYAMPQFPYRFIHFDSPDERGVDVALLYDSTRFVPFGAEALWVDLGEDKTRDVLYVSGVTLESGDTLYVLLCHLPSMLGGKALTDWKRARAKAVVQHRVDSVLAMHPDAYIVVMGDMNAAPAEDIRGLHNVMLDMPDAVTHCYQGRWTCLDQFYLSPSLAACTRASVYRPSWMLMPSKDGLDSIPRRTYRGFHYDHGGYSDHLPICLTLMPCAPSSVPDL